MTAIPQTIGWIGLGKMGLPICQRLKAAGHQVTVYARNPAGHERAATNGFASADTIAGLAAGAGIVFSAISGDAALTEITGSRLGLVNVLRPGQIYVDTSTVSPAASEIVATLLAEIEVPYLRAPVSGSTAMAETGQLTAIVSGPKEIFEQLSPVLNAFTRKQFHVGPGEEARTLKLTLNMLVGATSALVGEALTLGEKSGLAAATMLEVINASAVASPLIAYKSRMLVNGDYTPAFTLSQIMKDFDIALMVGRDVHCPLPLTALIRQQFEGAFSRGHGEEDFFVLAADAAHLAGLPAKT